MRSIKSYTCLILLLVITSCSTLDELTKFDISYDESVTIPALPISGVPLSINTPEIETDSESTFSINNTSKNLIEEIKLTEFRLTLVNPDDADFSFLETVEIYIAADDLEDKKLAWNPSPIVNDGNVMYLETTDEDLKEYIFKDSFYLKITTSTDEVLTEEHDIDIKTVFSVDALILGI